MYLNFSSVLFLPNERCFWFYQITQTGLESPDFEFRQGRFFFYSRPSDLIWNPLIILFNGHCVYFRSWIMRLTIHLHLTSKFNTSGAMPLLPIYPFIVRTRTTLLLTPTEVAFRNIISLSYSKISGLLCKPHNITIDQYEV
jgi:hypothetical protein